MRERLVAGIVLLLTTGILVGACQSAPASPTTTAATAAKPVATTAAQATTAPAATTAATKPAATAAAASSGTSTQAALEPCSLLTPADVQAVIGKAVDAKTMLATPQAADCEYFAASTNSKLAGFAVYPLTPSTAKGAHEATKGGGRNQVAVPGLGEDAYFDKDFGTIHVLQGRYSLSLSVTADATDDQLKATQALAAKLLTKLP